MCVFISLLYVPPAKYYDGRRPRLTGLVAVVRSRRRFENLPRADLERRALRHAEHTMPKDSAGTANGTLMEGKSTVYDKNKAGKAVAKGGGGGGRVLICCLP